MGDSRPRVGRLNRSVANARLLVRAALADIQSGSLVLVALSGGPDSLALLAGAAFEAPRAGLRFGAVIVDHQLQPDSNQVAVTAAKQAADLGADPVETVAVCVEGPGGPEAAARRARFAALHESARRTGAVALLLGHTADDQAEGVLLGLVRGSGTRSLAGMAARDGLLRRPFLTMRRAETLEVCRASGLTWWDDPHNSDPAYTRARVRTRVLPGMETELGPGVPAALARTAVLARDDADLLDALASDLEAGARRGEQEWDVSMLCAAPAALRSRALRSAAISAGCPPTELNAAHVAELSRLLDGGKRPVGLDLPGRVRARLTATTLHLSPAV